MVRRWTAGVVACLGLLPLLLGGCSAKHSASQSLPTTTTTATSSGSLPPVGPADFPVPTEARQRTPEGVKAFTKYYFELLNHQLPSLDTAPIRGLSSNCATCAAIADSYDQTKASGYRYEGGTFSLTGTGTAVISSDHAEVSFVVHEDATTVRDEDGNVVQGRSALADTYTGGLRLAWDQDRITWAVTQFDADRL